MALSSYRIPVAKTGTAYKLGWLREARNEAQLYLEGQPGYAQLEEDQKIIDRHLPDMASNLMSGGAWGVSPTGNVGNPSGPYIPETKRMASELIAILGNIEPSWAYGSENAEFRDISDIQDRCKQTWWERTSANEKIVECLQWAVTNRTGYIFPVWNRSFHGIPQHDVQNGDIELRVGGPKDYLRLWPRDLHNIQQDYAGTIKVKMPITEFAATWPTLAESVYPDGEQPPGIVGRALRGASSFWRPDTEKERELKPGRVPYVTVYWTYVHDMSLNITGNTVPMGAKGSHTYYEVPAFGSDIPTGLINTSTGQDLTRKAENDDCYLYPWLRLVIWTEDVICYDGPSYWFHGKIPAAKLTLDPWPWSYLGGSLVRDIASLEGANNRLVRSIDKRTQMRADPSRAVNEDLLDGTTIDSIREQINTPGGLVKVGRFMEGLLKPLTDPRDNQVDQWELEYGRMNKESMMDILGLNNLQRLAEKGQTPSGDTSEKLLEITGARTQRKGNLMEKFCLDLAPIVGGLILQWYDTEFRFALHGYKGVANYDFDFDPGTLVPANIPGRANQQQLKDREFGSSRSARFDTRAKRAKYLIAMMGTKIEKGSLLDITSMTRQLQEMRMWTDPTCPKDPITLFTSLKYNNIGTLDDDETKDTRMGRAKKWRRIVMEEAVEEQKQIAEIQQGATPEGKAAKAIGDLVRHTVGQSNGGSTGNPEGRKPTFAQPPQLQSKTRPDGTQDVIISTSGNR